MAGISCITDLVFDTSFSFIDSTYLTNRAVDPSEVKAVRCVLKGDKYKIKTVFNYNDQVYINRFAIPEGHGLKFSCIADLRISNGKFFTFRFCETDLLPEHKLREILSDSMNPERSVRVTTDAPIMLFNELATVRITFWYHKLNTFVAKLKFSFSKTAGDEWFECYMKYREQTSK
ncbi:Hypothetical protein PACV_68 [Pacmanvirus A23]|uniref:Hypothetical protein n=1 Tax=Pacmanvirus A23 TaxID=1932881 RepID=UPI000A093A6F|nr:Hypothetical protein B9W72_gp068 [Pacmanvirus A23]SIP85785.1 Hypothetical protein PACV_68 [Pacmanvirus A23]